MKIGMLDSAELWRHRPSWPRCCGLRGGRRLGRLHAAARARRPESFWQGVAAPDRGRWAPALRRARLQRRGHRHGAPFGLPTCPTTNLTAPTWLRCWCTAARGRERWPKACGSLRLEEDALAHGRDDHNCVDTVSGLGAAARLYEHAAGTAAGGRRSAYALDARWHALRHRLLLQAPQRLSRMPSILDALQDPRASNRQRGLRRQPPAGRPCAPLLLYWPWHERRAGGCGAACRHGSAPTAACTEARRPMSYTACSSAGATEASFAALQSPGVGWPSTRVIDVGDTGVQVTPRNCPRLS